MANFLNETLTPATTISADLISFVSGVTALNEAVALCLTEENDGLLLGMPIYGSFAVDFPTKSKYAMLLLPAGLL
jgi:bifunctional pyridoxal-dependent enzyme with beta-cystathionase and maltose regulon repressor activities